MVHKLFDQFKTLCGLDPAKIGPDQCTTDWDSVTCRRCTNSTFAPNMIRLHCGTAMREREDGRV